VGGQKLNHITVKQRRLLDLAGVAGAVDGLQFTTGGALLQREGSPMRVFLVAGDNDGRTGDLGVVAVGLGLPIGLELKCSGSAVWEALSISGAVVPIRGWQLPAFVSGKMPRHPP
jgi:hypothetical protein